MPVIKNKLKPSPPEVQPVKTIGIDKKVLPEKKSQKTEKLKQ